MDVGMQLVFASHGWDGIRDSQVMDEELHLSRLADELGFDVVWSVEHHFFDYSFCPDNTQLLSYLTAVTKNIDVGTAAIILPWNDPLRIAEKLALLDHLSGGRLRVGIGRGLSRREYAAFGGHQGIEMAQSRERFDEAADLILRALRTGFAEGDGNSTSSHASRSGRGRSGRSTTGSMRSPPAKIRSSRQRASRRPW